MQIWERAFAFRQRGKVENEQIQSAAEANEDLLTGLAQEVPEVNIDQTQQSKAEAKYENGEAYKESVE